MPANGHQPFLLEADEKEAEAVFGLGHLVRPSSLFCSLSNLKQNKKKQLHVYILARQKVVAEKFQARLGVASAFNVEMFFPEVETSGSTYSSSERDWMCHARGGGQRRSGKVRKTELWISQRGNFF